MLQILEFEEDNVVATRATEKLDEADYDELIPLLNRKLEQNEKIRWYFEMEDFKGWEGKAFWQDVTFDAKHLRILSGWLW